MLLMLDLHVPDDEGVQRLAEVAKHDKLLVYLRKVRGVLRDEFIHEEAGYGCS
jgi:hypothetical protein